MKRSEMIQYILDSVCGSYELDHKRVDEILSVLEKANVITPPEIRNPVYINTYTHYYEWCDDWAHNKAYGGNIEFEPYYINQWEKE